MLRNTKENDGKEMVERVGFNSAIEMFVECGLNYLSVLSRGK